MAQRRLRSHLYVRWIFLRLVSFCFFTAFLSMAVQVVGLYGEHGILPINPVLALILHKLGALSSCINFPTIFWADCSDSFLQTVCWSGAALSVVAFFGFFTGPVIAILWFLYLSIITVGQIFMGYQWDSLLLETALLATWFAPWGPKEIHPFNRKRFESQKEVSYVFLWLLRLLCFKLMMFSGVCKIASEDTTWRDLTAMTYHYYTQPLPTPLAWFAQKFPVPIQQLSTLLLFSVELVLPAILITCWRPARIAAAIGFILLMIVIMLTGNYAFFNWLTIALSLTLLDDDAILAIMPRSIKMAHRFEPRKIKLIIWNTAISIIPAILIGATAVGYLWMMVDRYRGEISTPVFLQIPVVLTRPLQSFSGYGLFAIMTTSRREIIVEGSNDGTTWLPYEFKYKPGDIHRAPPIVAPHQPRLDWQMWFASLAPAQHSPWFDSFVKCLLDGSPSVLGLLETNPFPRHPPKYIRATLYDYQFSDFGSLFSRGEWWHREKKDEFYPATSLDDLKTPTFNPEL